MIQSLIYLLNKEFGLLPSQLDLLLKRAPYTYKQYHIRKRNGGVRLIAQPARETKLIQRWLIQKVFSELPLHSAAVAYRDGIGIAHNAELHAKNPYLLKCDFRNFFNSIRYVDVRDFLTSRLKNKFDDVDIARIAEVSCFKSPSGGLCLSVGAPSSPILSNAILFDLDEKIAAWCSTKRVVYSRYADDLSFSTAQKGICYQILPQLKVFMRELSIPFLELNESKTVYTSKKYSRQVTGLVLDNDGKVSLGRDRKRNISSLIHRFKLKVLSAEDSYRLQGLLGFALDIEPDFVGRMNRKYGGECLSSIFALRKPAEDKFSFVQLMLPF